MKRENTIYHTEEYLDPNSQTVKSNSLVYDDIHTSEWFSKTHEKIIKHSNTHNDTLNILCPIIFFIDGVAIDKLGRKSLEPVSFTLGIFKREIRNLALAWRVLGYIPDTEKCFGISYGSGKQGSKLKRDHHQQILHHILAQVVDIQKVGGFKWKLPFYNDDCSVKMKDVTLNFEVMVVIGDMPGSDKLCGRKQNYSATKSLDTGTCRDCNVTFKDCIDYRFKCQPLIRDILKTISSEEVEKLSFHEVARRTSISKYFLWCR